MPVNAVPKPGAAKTSGKSKYQSATEDAQSLSSEIIKAMSKEVPAAKGKPSGPRKSQNISLAIPGSNGEVKIPGVPGILTATGFTLKVTATYEEWESFGQFFSTVRGMTAWGLGDWINAGEERFGEKYAQAIEATQYDPQTLANFASTAHRVPPENRDPELSWSHHEAVAKLKLPDQKLWLDRAKAEGWGQRTLRDMLKAEKDGAAPATNGTVVTGEVVNPPPTPTTPGEDGEADEDLVEVTLGQGDGKAFELTPQETAAKRAYEKLAMLVTDFKSKPVPVADIAGVLVEGPAKALYEALPGLMTFLIDLHGELSKSLGLLASESDDDENEQATGAAEDAHTPVTV